MTLDEFLNQLRRLEFKYEILEYGIIIYDFRESISTDWYGHALAGIERYEEFCINLTYGLPIPKDLYDLLYEYTSTPFEERLDIEGLEREKVESIVKELIDKNKQLKIKINNLTGREESK